MALWVCLSCTTKYAVGLFRCPRCHGTEFVEDGQPMPKITVHGGATNDAAAMETGEEEPWPGNSSSGSSPMPEPSSKPSSRRGRKPAPTTENPSEPDPTDSSTARSMDGDQTEPTSGSQADTEPAQ